MPSAGAPVQSKAAVTAGFLIVQEATVPLEKIGGLQIKKRWNPLMLWDFQAGVSLGFSSLRRDLEK